MRLTFRPHFYEPLFFTLVRIPKTTVAPLFSKWQKLEEVKGPFLESPETFSGPKSYSENSDPLTL